MKNAESTQQFLSGGGETGHLIRSMDWSTSPLDDVNNWPQSLRSALSICLGSSFPIALYWGKELTLLYNDAWSPIPGNKHPWALGQPGREVWPELWDTIGPMFEHVIATGEATRSEDALLPMRRHGYTEECYFDYTFTPIRGEGGKVEGIFNAVIETTYRVINERRTQFLQNLSQSINVCRSVDEISRLAVKALESSNRDLPFFLLYIVDENPENTTRARLVAATGLALGEPINPRVLALDDNGEDSPWPVSEVLSTNQPKHLTDLTSRFGELPLGVWPEPVEEALIVPLAQNNSGFIIAGISPRRALDREYQNFIESIANHISSALLNVRAYEEERQRAEALAEIDKAKTAFFSNVSHEFRTPLTLILGPLEELLHQPDGIPGHVLQSVQATHRNALRLHKLVNSLLEFSRIEAGRVQACFRPVNLGALTRDLSSGFRSIIEKAGLEFEVNCESLGNPVYLDREMWEKIVLNLLSNAFKYTLKGKISVSLKREGDWAVLRVQDTGAGIPDHELPRMFERFHRVPNTVGRSHEGTGIGLSLVHELVKLHFGQIMVQSTEGEGSTFTVCLPLGKDHLPPQQVTDKPDRPVSSSLVSDFLQEVAPLLEDTGEALALEDLTIEKYLSSNGKSDAEILIIDDNVDMRSYLQRLLEPHFQVRTAGNGRSALERIARKQPDLILSDVMMPVMDGKQLLSVLRKNSATARIPVILLSARAGEEARIDGLEAGADDYLVKPFSGRELITKVKSQIKIARARNNNEAQLRNLFMQAPMAISISRGPDHVVELANERTLEIWKKTADEVLNKPAYEIFPELKGTALDDIARTVYERGERYVSPESPIQLFRNGKLETIYAQFVYEPLRNEDGTITGIMTVGHEITDLVVARQLAQSSAQELEMKVKERTAELEERNAELKQQKEFGEVILDSSNDLIGVYDLETRFLALNRKCEEYYSVSRSEVIGRKLLDVFPMAEGTISHQNLLKALRGEEVHFESYKSPIINKYFETYYIPLRDKRNDIYAVLVTSHDITASVEAAEKLQHTNEELKRTNQELEQFAYVSSHDLQEPLRKIQTFSDMILSKINDPGFNAGSYLEKINSSAQRMSVLIKDLLNYSRVTQAEQRFEKVDLNQVLENVLGDFEVLIRQKNAEIQSTRLPVIMGIPVQLNQLFYNLISNSLKFSDKPPLIKLSARQIHSSDYPLPPPLESNGRFLELLFEDNGIGFDQGYVDKIFTIFQRLNDRQKYSGTGIGLAICKKIVENHGGHIMASGVEGKGATFRILLPLETDLSPAR